MTVVHESRHRTSTAMHGGATLLLPKFNEVLELAGQVVTSDDIGRMGDVFKGDAHQESTKDGFWFSHDIGGRQDCPAIKGNFADETIAFNEIFDVDTPKRSINYQLKSWTPSIGDRSSCTEFNLDLLPVEDDRQKNLDLVIARLLLRAPDHDKLPDEPHSSSIRIFGEFTPGTSTSWTTEIHYRNDFLGKVTIHNPKIPASYVLIINNCIAQLISKVSLSEV